MKDKVLGISSRLSHSFQNILYTLRHKCKVSNKLLMQISWVFFYHFENELSVLETNKYCRIIYYIFQLIHNIKIIYKGYILIYKHYIMYKTIL